jgi:hypothetical protein
MGKDGKLEDDIDALFMLPLAEFIDARKTLAARLKKEGRAIDVERVTALAKPSVSAWTVNQLYWKHRQAFDRLIAASQRFHKAQSSRQAGKVGDMREALDARREALGQLSDLATELLNDAGHNPSLDTLRRITTTLEAISAYALLPDGPVAGRLTKDVDPPGFESLASFIPAASKKSASTQTRQKVTTTEKAESPQELRRAKITAAKASLQEAKKLLVHARATAQSLETEQRKIDLVAKETEKQRREAEERFKKARFVAEDATRRARSAKEELEEARKALEDANRKVDKASKELESLFRES